MNFGHWSQCCWYCHGARSGRRERGDCDQCRDMCQCAGVASHRGAHAAPCQGWHLQHNTTGTGSRSRSSPPKGQCAGDSGLWQECQVGGVNTLQYTDIDIDSLWIQIQRFYWNNKYHVWSICLIRYLLHQEGTMKLIYHLSTWILRRKTTEYVITIWVVICKQWDSTWKYYKMYNAHKIKCQSPHLCDKSEGAPPSRLPSRCGLNKLYHL